MQRWPENKLHQHIDLNLNAAKRTMTDYENLLPCVKAIITKSGIDITAGPASIKCLAGRDEYILFEIVNQKQGPQAFHITGSVNGKPIEKTSGLEFPRSRTYLPVKFAVDKPGSYDIHLVLTCDSHTSALDLKALAEPSYRLVVNIIDAKTQKPCAARVFIKGSDGRYVIAAGRPIELALTRNNYKYGYADGKVEAVLPRGETNIKIQKGFEYKIAEKVIDFNKDKSATIHLERWIDMPALGWFSGDTHVHWVKHNWYENDDPDWLNMQSCAEDLWVNNNLILKHWWKKIVSDEHPQGLVANRPDTFPVGMVEKYSVDGRIVWTAEEYRNDEIFGHLNFLRVNKLIEPVSTGFMGGPDSVHYPPNSYLFDEVRQAGGIVIAAHDVVMEVPIQVLLGKLDSVDAFRPTRYYKLLNCGFRVPLSSGSDYPARLMGCSRAYVYCGPQLNYNTWVDNLAAGKTFVSSGTMLFFKADGKSIGDTIHLESGQTRQIDIKATALCKNLHSCLEIVHNGQVIKRIDAENDSRKIVFDGKISIQEPGWLAARAFPENADSNPNWWPQSDAAHTSPIYIQSGNQRLIKKDAVHFLIGVLQAAYERAEKSDMYASEAQKKEVLEYYKNGITQFRKLLKSAH